MRTYQLLRYGVKVQTAAGELHRTVHLIDWEHPQRNDFALAEEVTPRGGHERRPDLVLYVNGVAIVVIELKRSSTDMAEGALRIDRAMREDVPADWKGTQAKDAEVKNVLYRLVGEDREATLRLFDLVKNQPGYR